ncbi:hypothetical protein [Streptomyces bauhiniae]|uniref:Uncharacterized protein n=1 Tax=Streptomyces bauhiniae TaxID=2340725 RepID=A0A7K3QTF7_9ACTN|nr:hypothetical protein [Streptomyces bauhiniae]NEB93187.1 hypothetical protein [Streptomyces bauhiniae]
MTGYQCGSCSYKDDDVDGLRRQTDRMGHVGIRETACVHAPEGAEAAPAAGTREAASGRGRVVAAAGFLAATVTIGILAWKNKALATERDELAAENGRLKSENDGLNSMNRGLLVQLAELVVENVWLKSASGAGSTLGKFRGSPPEQRESDDDECT